MNALENYIKVNQKKKVTGALLAFFFGPLGLLYSNWVAAVLLTVLAFGLAITIPGSQLLVWIVAFIYSFFAVDKFNNKLKAKADLIFEGGV
jgi:uncharacterized membrane protein (DUF485 family)